MSRVLVTGANSFVGRHIAAHLASCGMDVVGTRRGDDVEPDVIAKTLSPNRMVDMIQLDLAERESFRRLPSRVDAVLHIAGVSPSANISINEMLRCNIRGTQNVAEYAVRAGAERMIFASSMSAFGRISVDEVDENTPIFDPDVYGASKLCGERLIEAIAHRVPSIAVRLPGVLGRGAHRAWIPTVLERLRNGDAVSIFNPGALFNNAAHVDDLAAMAFSFLSRQWSGFASAPVGADGYMTVREVIERLCGRAGREFAVQEHSSGAKSFTISSRFAIEHFGYKPSHIGAILDRYFDETT